MSDFTITEADRGKAKDYDQAYSEGYAAKYQEWSNRENPYPEDSTQERGFDDGYAEACNFV